MFKNLRVELGVKVPLLTCSASTYNMPELTLGLPISNAVITSTSSWTLWSVLCHVHNGPRCASSVSNNTRTGATFVSKTLRRATANKNTEMSVQRPTRVNSVIFSLLQYACACCNCNTPPHLSTRPLPLLWVPTAVITAIIKALNFNKVTFRRQDQDEILQNVNIRAKP